MRERLAHKQIQSLKRDGVETPEGRVKIDMEAVETLAKMIKINKAAENESK
jgi:predicted class III extradiol MEMO1 family dioxygenase